MKMTGAQAVIKALELEEVKIIFGYPGAAICPFYDALYGSDTIKHVLTRHEQGAAHAASGYARVTGKTGVCVATSGPGATNLITGIATAYMDSIPLVAITGQVSSELIGRDVFQEADITGATSPFCKHNYLVKNIKDLPRIIKEAFHIASTGRPGPVIIDIPVDIQNKELDFKYPTGVDIKGYKPTYKGHSMQIKKAVEALKKAKAPLICAGGGIINANASEILTAFAEKCNIPITSTLMGIGAVPTRHPLNLGMVGSHGNYASNYAMHNTDFLIILGARVGDRAMGAATKIASKAQIVHIDIDPAEIGKNIGASIPIVGDVKNVLEEIFTNTEKGEVQEWVSKLQKLKLEHGIRKTLIEVSQYVKPAYVFEKLESFMDEDSILTTEVGQNQIWAASHHVVTKPRKFISSGGMGTMGYGLPASVGAKLGCPQNKVVAIAGDGSFQMSMQELGTIKQENLGVKMIIFNNSRLGMVREIQKTKYCGRYCQVILEQNPDFVKLVEAYGFKGMKVTSNDEVENALRKMFEDDLPFLLEFIVDPEEPTLM